MEFGHLWIYALNKEWTLSKSAMIADQSFDTRTGTHGHVVDADKPLQNTCATTRTITFYKLNQDI